MYEAKHEGEMTILGVVCLPIDPLTKIPSNNFTKKMLTKVWGKI